mgnify:CR=1 FL=1
MDRYIRICRITKRGVQQVYIFCKSLFDDEDEQELTELFREDPNNKRFSDIFEPDGSIREFGIGRKKKTIIPLWLIVFIIAFLSYLTINTLSQRGMLDM